MAAFAALNLHPKINDALNDCGYTKPTPIQNESIPNILGGKDLVASAQTGTGKTAAFVLPALHRISHQQTKKTRVLILTPTRELANQITKSFSTYGKFLKFKIASLVGGMPYHHQLNDLAKGCDVIVATPGRLLDHIDSKRVDLSSIEMLVLDEADRMLDMGFIDDVQYIAKLTPSSRQTLLFSATVDPQLINVVRHLLKNPVRIDMSNEKIGIPQIKQEAYKTFNLQQKMQLLHLFLKDENIYKAIIFSATKQNADQLAAQLRDQGFKAAALHGDLKQNVRNRTIDQLRRGKIQYLVATDVAARGIDISDISHVFNFDLPRFCEDYVHRIGRTGRAGKSGVAISFVLPSDTRHLQRIERYTGQPLKLIRHPDIDEGRANREPKRFNEKKAKKAHHYHEKTGKSSGEKTQKTYRYHEKKERSNDEKSSKPYRHYERKERSNDEKSSKPYRHYEKKERSDDEKSSKPYRHYEKKERSNERTAQSAKKNYQNKTTHHSKFQSNKRPKKNKFSDGDARTKY